MYRVSGRRIQHNGKNIQLYGVNVIGMELLQPVIGGLWAGLTIKQYLAAIKALKFNCLRLPIGPRALSNMQVDQGLLATWMPENAYLAGKGSLEILDEWIKEAELIGMRYFFDIHYLRPDNGTIPDLWYDGAYTETMWLNNMKQLALRYKGNPGFVGIDTKNEPNSNTATWGSGNVATDFKIASEKAYQAINSVNDQILIITEPLGLTGGLKELQNNPANIPEDRHVLSPHIYGPDVWWPFGEGFNQNGFPNAQIMYPIWDRIFGDTAQQKAVIVGEWGGEYGKKHPLDKPWQDLFSTYLRDRGIRDFAYWGWGENSHDTGGILANGDWRTVRTDKVEMINKIWTSEATFNEVQVVVPPVVVPPVVVATEYRVSGNRVYHNGNRIQLFSVNLIGMELQQPVVGGLWTGITIKAYLEKVKAAGFNALRLPIGPKALSGMTVDQGLTASGWYAPNGYLGSLNSLQLCDEWIKEAEALGLRYLFDVHQLRDNGTIPDLWYDGTYTEAIWLQNITQLATRYKGKPGFVGIDIKNEPSSNTATWGTGNTATDWRLAVNKAYAAINAVNTDILIIVSTIRHTNGMQEVLANPPTIPLNRLLWTIHIYGPDVWNPNASDTQDPNFPSNMPAIWDAMVQPAIGAHAIYLGEFGGMFGEDHPLDDDWQIAFVDWLIDREIDDMGYWGWGPNSGGDTGGILADDWTTIKTAKLNNILRMKNAYATLSSETTTPIDIPEPPEPPVIVKPTKYRARGNRILHNGHDIQIFGVNLIGMELQDATIGGLWSGLTIKAYLQQIKNLRFNTLRLPIGPRTLSGVEVNGGLIATWLPENEYLIGKNSLQILDEWIKECELIGMRYIFDHHYLENGNIPPKWYTAEFTEEEWIADLVQLSTRYKGRPGFIGIDLKNEPNINECTWGDGNMATDWRLAVGRAYQAIQAVNDDILVFVEWLGTAPGLQQLADNPAPIPLNRLVLSPHLYGPDVWWDFGEGFLAVNFPYNMPAIWERQFGSVAKTQAVFVGEFGGQMGRAHALDDDWQRQFVEYLRVQKIIHFAYWGWGDNSGGDTGGILEPDWRTARADKMALLDEIYTDQAKYSNQTMTVITPIDPPPPGDPGTPSNPGIPTEGETGGGGIDPDYPFDSQYPVKALTRKKVGVDYKSLLIRLFPRGRAWKIEHDTVTSMLMEAFAVELQRVDFAIDRLMTELDPRTTQDLLPEWEAEYGLPDECSVLADNFADRRVNLVRKVIAVGGQSEAYYRSLSPAAATMKVTVGVPSYLPMALQAPLRGMAFKFIWFVNFDDSEYKWASANDPADTPINTKLEIGNIRCILERHKPAHTHIVYI